MRCFCLNCKHFSIRDPSVPLQADSYVDCALRPYIRDVRLWKMLQHYPDSVFYREELTPHECGDFEARPLEELVAEKLSGKWKIPDDGKLGGEALMREIAPDLFNPPEEEL